MKNEAKLRGINADAISGTIIQPIYLYGLTELCNIIGEILILA